MWTFSKIQSNDSILCGFYCIKLIREMDKGKSFYDTLYEFRQFP
jgi:hypothetical protein